MITLTRVRPSPVDAHVVPTRVRYTIDVCVAVMLGMIVVILYTRLLSLTKTVLTGVRPIDAVRDTRQALVVRKTTHAPTTCINSFRVWNARI